MAVLLMSYYLYSKYLIYVINMVVILNIYMKNIFLKLNFNFKIIRFLIINPCHFEKAILKLYSYKYFMLKCVSDTMPTSP